jgi:hypothetical protein
MGTTDAAAVKAFRTKPAPGNEARDLREFTAILAHWTERGPDGVPRGILLDDQTIQEIPVLHKIVFGAVVISAHPDDGQVFKAEGGAYGLNAGVYFSIAQAAGMSFPDEAMMIDASASKFPDRVVAKVGALRNDLAGQPQFKSGMYTLDIDTKCDRERVKYQGRNLPEAEVEAKVHAYRLNLRESNVQRAITGATRAAVKAHFGKLRRKWLLEDFEIPVIIPRLVVDMTRVLETSEGRSMLAATATGLARVMAFGGRGTSMMGLGPAPAPTLSLPPGAGHVAGQPFVDPDPDEDDHGHHASEEVQSGKKEDPKPSRPADWPTPAQFAEMTREARIKTFDDLLATRNMTRGPKNPIGDYSDVVMLQWYEAALKAPVKEDTP